MSDNTNSAVAASFARANAKAGVTTHEANPNRTVAQAFSEHNVRVEQKNTPSSSNPVEVQEYTSPIGPQTQQQTQFQSRIPKDSVLLTSPSIQQLRSEKQRQAQSIAIKQQSLQPKLATQQQINKLNPYFNTPGEKTALKQYNISQNQDILLPIAQRNIQEYRTKTSPTSGTKLIGTELQANYDIAVQKEKQFFNQRADESVMIVAGSIPAGFAAGAMAVAAPVTGFALTGFSAFELGKSAAEIKKISAKYPETAKYETQKLAFGTLGSIYGAGIGAKAAFKIKLPNVEKIAIDFGKAGIKQFKEEFNIPYTEQRMVNGKLETFKIMGTAKEEFNPRSPATGNMFTDKSARVGGFTRRNYQKYSGKPSQQNVGSSIIVKEFQGARPTKEGFYVKEYKVPALAKEIYGTKNIKQALVPVSNQGQLDIVKGYRLQYPRGTYPQGKTFYIFKSGDLSRTGNLKGNVRVIESSGGMGEVTTLAQIQKSQTIIKGLGNQPAKQISKKNNYILTDRIYNPKVKEENLKTSLPEAEIYANKNTIQKGFRSTALKEKLIARVESKKILSELPTATSTVLLSETKIKTPTVSDIRKITRNEVQKSRQQLYSSKKILSFIPERINKESTYYKGKLEFIPERLISEVKSQKTKKQQYLSRYDNLRNINLRGKKYYVSTGIETGFVTAPILERAANQRTFQGAESSRQHMTASFLGISEKNKISNVDIGISNISGRESNSSMVQTPATVRKTLSGELKKQSKSEDVIVKSIIKPTSVITTEIIKPTQKIEKIPKIQSIPEILPKSIEQTAKSVKSEQSVSQTYKSRTYTPKSLELPKELRAKEKKGRLYVSAFNVEVKRGGKFKTVFTGLTKSEALGKGAKLTENTLARTFRIRESGRTVSNKKRFGFNTGRFYQKKGKRDTFIQKARFSLGTFGEIGEIQRFKENKKIKF